MNWRRGIFRIWIVLSGTWILLVVIFSASRLQEIGNPISISDGDQKFEFPNDLPRDALKAELIQFYAKKSNSSFDPNAPYEVVPTKQYATKSNSSFDPDSAKLVDASSAKPLSGRFDPDSAKLVDASSAKPLSGRFDPDDKQSPPKPSMIGSGISFDDLIPKRPNVPGSDDLPPTPAQLHESIPNAMKVKTQGPWTILRTDEIAEKIIGSYEPKNRLSAIFKIFLDCISLPTLSMMIFLAANWILRGFSVDPMKAKARPSETAHLHPGEENAS